MPYETLLKRIRAEYLEMPGLHLRLEQAQRLCGMERMVCRQVFDALLEARFLCVTPDGSYVRLTDGADVPRPRPAKADLRNGTRSRHAS
jgi:hypothetical protein